MPPYEEADGAELDNQHFTKDFLELTTSGKYVCTAFILHLKCHVSVWMCLEHTSSEPHPLHLAAEGTQLVEAAEGPSLYGQAEGSSDSEEYLTPPSSPCYDQVSLC